MPSCSDSTPSTWGSRLRGLGTYGDATTTERDCLLGHSCRNHSGESRPRRSDTELPAGSGTGINQLCQQGLANVASIDFARSSRGPKTGDCDGLQFTAFARDGISWHHFTSGRSEHPSNAVTNLTQDQLRKIFVTGEINNWSQVGGTSAPIVVYAAQAGSGTRTTFDGFVGGSSSSQIPAGNQATQ